jgi:hypothetical protein
LVSRIFVHGDVAYYQLHQKVNEMAQNGQMIEGLVVNYRASEEHAVFRAREVK